MPTLAETFRAFYAFWRLFLFDERVVALFPYDRIALWRSFRILPLAFFVALTFHWLAAPGYFVKLGFNFASFAPYMLCQQMITVCGFYLVLEQLSHRLKSRAFLAHYITVQNWMTLPLFCMYALFDLLLTLKGIPLEEATGIMVIPGVISLLVSWSVTVATLRLGQLMGLGVCVLEGLFAMIVAIGMQLIVLSSLPPVQGG